MRRILHSAFVAVLSLALSASGATLGLAHIAAHGKLSQHSHHGAAHTHHAHHAHHETEQTGSDESSHPANDHPSKNCCSACIVASPLPQVPAAVIELSATAAVYSILSQFDVPVSILVDPGIPKRMG
jgi:hypothetical protein